MRSQQRCRTHNTAGAQSPITRSPDRPSPDRPSPIADHPIADQRASSEAGADRRRTALAYANGAVFELRNLSERIEDRIGQAVRGGFVIAERHEHRPAWHPIVGARIEGDLAAARFDRENVAGW